MGWSTIPESDDFHDYPLFTTKRALREGLRYHIARFHSKRVVDPTNPEEFTRPVLLHRRDPRQPPPGKELKEEESLADIMDSKEREKLEAAKAEKARQKAEDMAQIAPTGNNAAAMAAKKTKSFRNEKTSQVWKTDKTAEDNKATRLKYEESLPWHIEDADNKNTWVGSYEAALSKTNVMFVIENSRFLMVPLEKWYKFTSKSQFKTFTIEEAEAQLKKSMKESRWVMKSEEDKKAEADKREYNRIMRGAVKVKGESQTLKNSGKRETEDMDELDFAADELFQDDDENVNLEPDNDEDTKLANDKIKREQRGANLFGEADEMEVDKQLQQELAELERTKREGKSTKKALKKRERNLLYQSDTEHPYSTASEDDTSDEEKQAEIDRKKDEEAKMKAKLEAKSEPKLASGASTKGTNTPSGRPKHTDALKKSKSLKRPGSPNLSESSGNESARKKPKKKHGTTGTSTPSTSRASPAPVSQPAPGQASRKSSIIKLQVGSSKLSEIDSLPPRPGSPVGASMSDTEATGGEMSDNAIRKKKLKLNVNRTGTPSGSRAGSPIPAIQGRASSAGGSRATSPHAQPQCERIILDFPFLVYSVVLFNSVTFLLQYNERRGCFFGLATLAMCSLHFMIFTIPPL